MKELVWFAFCFGIGVGIIISGVGRLFKSLIKKRKTSDLTWILALAGTAFIIIGVVGVRLAFEILESSIYLHKPALLGLYISIFSMLFGVILTFASYSTLKE